MLRFLIGRIFLATGVIPLMLPTSVKLCVYKSPAWMHATIPVYAADKQLKLSAQKTNDSKTLSQRTDSKDCLVAPGKSFSKLASFRYSCRGSHPASSFRKHAPVVLIRSHRHHSMAPPVSLTFWKMTFPAPTATPSVKYPYLERA